MSTGKIVLGTLAGLAIGAVAGILFAPDKGSVTRKKIMDKSDDMVDELKSKLDGFCDSISEKFESTKQEVEETVSKGKAVYDDVKKRLETLLLILRKLHRKNSILL
ncbi:MAG: YtxH domain-containing protein [Bacteroidetes bacterium]|nr:YtxH domain-containing protein [Bacteroidota bacterium]